MKGLIRSSRNILMEMRKICQHGYLGAPSIDEDDSKLPIDEQHKRLIAGSGKLVFLKLLLPKLKERGHRVLLFSQFKIALNCIEDFLVGEGFKYLRLDGDIQQAERQKDMDKFNAPDSEYFIYLLTTRAGGVGINLATADTVIIFDPDFNPHQDLQAIARSHRYGQKKKVLVFKLMTKNSCEEKIVQAGKKKMVLDHLVVQSIDAEHEEGDLDSVLLHGTAALYEKEVDGVSASDVVYNSKNVDEMIDKVEKEAEDMALAMEEKDRLEAEAEARGEALGGQSKEAKSFGFAKIWEADQNGLKEVDEEDEEVDDGEIHRIIAQAHQDRLRREKEEAERNGIRYRQAKAGTSNQPDLGAFLSDGEGGDGDTPKKQGKKGKKMGKRKKGDPRSDDDFAPMAIDSDSDASDDLQGEAEAIIGEDGLPYLVGEVSLQSAPGRLAAPGPMGVKKRKYTKHGLNGNGIGANAAAGPSNHPANGSASANGVNGASPAIMNPGQVAAMLDGRVPLDPADLAARRAAKNAAKSLERRKLLGATAVTQHRAALVSAQMARSGRSVPSESARHPLSRLGGPSRGATSIHQLSPVEAISLGRYCVYWMYHVLRQFGYVKELNHWARAALTELDPRMRKKCFEVAAIKVDTQLEKTGSKKFCTVQLHREAVYALIDSKLEWVDGYGDKAMQALPMEPVGIVGASGAQIVQQSQQVERGEGVPAEAGPSGRRGIPNGTVQEETEGFNGGVISASAPTGVDGPATAERSDAAPSTIDAIPSGKTTDGTQCLMCDSSDHTFLDCPGKVELGALSEYMRDVILLSPASADKTASVERIRKIVEVCRRAGTAIPAELEEAVKIPANEQENGAVQAKLAEEQMAADVTGANVGVEPVDAHTHGDATPSVPGTNQVFSEAAAAAHSTAEQHTPVPCIAPAEKDRSQAHLGPSATDQAPSVAPPPPASTTERESAQGPSDTGSPPKKRHRPAPLTMRHAGGTSTIPHSNEGPATTSDQSLLPSSQRPRSWIGLGSGTQEDAFMLVDSDDEMPSTPIPRHAPAKAASEVKPDQAGPSTPRAATPVDASDPAGPSTPIIGERGGQPPRTFERDAVSPFSASQSSARPRAGSTASSRPTQTPRGRKKLFTGCLICGNSFSHAAVDCPLVRAGSQSIKHAMMRFLPSDALYDILESLRVRAVDAEHKEAQTEADAAARSAPPKSLDSAGTGQGDVCPFCQTSCARSIKACAEAHGGRQALKNLIRRVTDEEGEDSERADELYDVYKDWPK